ncbi:MAG TPA: hypothetical protein VLR90_01110, partial [Blastocatellia bacterium]|nr:hypothetical protein [Blastocatellia bacterium]
AYAASLRSSNNRSSVSEQVENLPTGPSEGFEITWHCFEDQQFTETRIRKVSASGEWKLTWYDAKGSLIGEMYGRYLPNTWRAYQDPSFYRNGSDGRGNPQLFREEDSTRLARLPALRTQPLYVLKDDLGILAWYSTKTGPVALREEWGTTGYLIEPISIVFRDISEKELE